MRRNPCPTLGTTPDTEGYEGRASNSREIRQDGLLWTTSMPVTRAERSNICKCPFGRVCRRIPLASYQQKNTTKRGNSARSWRNHTTKTQASSFHSIRRETLQSGTILQLIHHRACKSSTVHVFPQLSRLVPLTSFVSQKTKRYPVRWPTTAVILQQ